MEKTRLSWNSVEKTRFCKKRPLIGIFVNAKTSALYLLSWNPFDLQYLNVADHIEPRSLQAFLLFAHLPSLPQLWGPHCLCWLFWLGKPLKKGAISWFCPKSVRMGQTQSKILKVILSFAGNRLLESLMLWVGGWSLESKIYSLLCLLFCRPVYSKQDCNCSPCWFFSCLGTFCMDPNSYPYLSSLM